MPVSIGSARREPLTGAALLTSRATLFGGCKGSITGLLRYSNFLTNQRLSFSFDEQL